MAWIVFAEDALVVIGMKVKQLNCVGRFRVDRGRTRGLCRQSRVMEGFVLFSLATVGKCFMYFAFDVPSN